MPITVRRTPNLVNYGAAVAKAAEKTTAADRSSQYANYLAGIQQANQSFNLGLGGLDVQRQNAGTSAQESANKLAISKRELEQKDVGLQLERDKLNLQKQVAQRASNVSFINAAGGLFG